MYTELIGTKKNLVEFAKEKGITVEEIDLSKIDQCSHCDIWRLKKDLVLDLDNNLIDKHCERFYGL
jgi:multimeric flavodoxin WrbA